MTKLEIYNIALAMNGKKATKEELSASCKPTEVDACDSMYGLAVESVLGECDWSYFVHPVRICINDDVPYGGWSHGYAVEDCDLYRIARVDAGSRPFALLGGRLYTNEDDPCFWGISMDAFILETAPRDFCMLVGLYLGYLVSTILSPSDTAVAQRALQAYSGQLAAARKSESNNFSLNYIGEGDWSALHS